MPSRTWTDAQLTAAVAVAPSWSQVAKLLGLRGSGGTTSRLQRHAIRLDLDTSHLPRLVDGRPLGRRKFNDDELRAAVEECSTLADVMRRLGYHPSGGMHRWIRARIRELGLDTSHFVGQGWAKGKPGRSGFKKRPLSELLVDGTSTSGSHLLRRLIAEGVKEAVCERCGGTEWQGEPMPLHLDHVNGEPTDNRLENLRVLCPNCHALTPTYCGRKNRGRVAKRQTRQI